MSAWVSSGGLHRPSSPCGDWNGSQPQTNDPSSQTRRLWLKIHYTFGQSGSMPCLARWADPIDVPCVAINKNITVGAVSLGICLHAITIGSPELLQPANLDYAIYAVDYSEPETPLVGHGLLSVALSNAASASQEPVTGRVTRNMFSAFNNTAQRETLDVKMQLTPIPKINSAQSRSNLGLPPTVLIPQPQLPQQLHQSQQSQSQTDVSKASSHYASFPGSVDISEWNATLGSLGSQPVAVSQSNSRVQTPTLPCLAAVSSAEVTIATQAQIPPSSTGLPVETEPIASTPRLRTAKLRNGPTRPRGRPRKRPLETAPAEANTSGCDENTETEYSQPKRRRVTVTRAEKTTNPAFSTQVDSLRGVAIASEGLRNIRPAPTGGPTVQGPTTALPAPVPRAPTPIPTRRQDAALDLSRPQSVRVGQLHNVPHQLAQESRPQNVADVAFAIPNAAVDARSPTVPSRMVSPTKSLLYASVGASPAEFASSPPVARSTTFSPAPMASSPRLPPMITHTDSGFMSGEVDEDFVFTRQGKAEAALLVARAKRHQSQQQKSGMAALSAHVNIAPPVKIAPKPIAPTLAAEPSGHEAVATVTKPTDPKPFPTISTPVINATNPGSDVGSQHTLQGRVTPRTDTGAVSVTETCSPALVPANGLSTAPLDPVPVDLLTCQLSGSTNTASQDPVVVPTVQKSSTTVAALSQQLKTLPNPSVGNEKPSGPIVASNPTLTLPQMPASDPVLPPPLSICLSEPPPALCPLSDAPQGHKKHAKPSGPSKNLVKKQSIVNRLNEAVANGKLPTFCANCGSIVTPTWRKMFSKQIDGTPPFIETSKEPGRVVSVDILERDVEGNPTKYRLVKKSLAQTDPHTEWSEMVLCNPCGIWITKYRSQRPEEKWKRDDTRGGQTRRRTLSMLCGTGASQIAKELQQSGAGKSTETVMLKANTGDDSNKENVASNESTVTEIATDLETVETSTVPRTHHDDPFCRTGPVSGHYTRASAASHQARKDDVLGGTRRLLFPSPRKDGGKLNEGEPGTRVALGSVHLNVPTNSPGGLPQARRTSPRYKGKGKASTGPQEVAVDGRQVCEVSHDDSIDEQYARDLAIALQSDCTAPHFSCDPQEPVYKELFGDSPTPRSRQRAATPTSSCHGGVPPKTPTRAAHLGHAPRTPAAQVSHRPVTRSVAKSIRSSVSGAWRFGVSGAGANGSLSPTMARILTSGGGSATKRRSPRYAVADSNTHSGDIPTTDAQLETLPPIIFDETPGAAGANGSPYTRSLAQLISEAHQFTAGSAVGHDLASLMMFQGFNGDGADSDLNYDVGHGTLLMENNHGAPITNYHSSHATHNGSGDGGVPAEGQPSVELTLESFQPPDGHLPDIPTDLASFADAMDLPVDVHVDLSCVDLMSEHTYPDPTEHGIHMHLGRLATSGDNDLDVGHFVDLVHYLETHDAGTANLDTIQQAGAADGAADGATSRVATTSS